MYGMTTEENGKNTMTLQVIKDVILRSLALFISFALPSVGVGAFAGVEPVKAAAIAGTVQENNPLSRFLGRD